MIFYFTIFLLGLSIGSFLNVLVYREAEGKSFLWGRSFCDNCHKQIAWYDNIPLLSYVYLRGKCRHCHKKISVQYPFIELLTGLEFVWIAFLIRGNLSFFSQFEGFYSFLSLFIWLLLGACFLAIFMADVKYQIIPDSAVFFGIILALLKMLVDYRYTGMADFSVFLAGILASLFFLSLYLLTQGKGMGFGDVKLALLLGLVLGFPKAVIAVFTAFLTGALVGVILIIARQKKLKSKIAFGPFLILGLVFSLGFGNIIWQWFLGY
jgi:leader peptidase (prepilin peptidase) / N-methyltransferase